ncbi:MAG TPA: PilZ domain-containing protein, partial [Myxococcales bacterium]|nr:PilZ domain-containing protein [Myxococcales bacterium]
TKECRYQFGGRLAPQLYSHLIASTDDRPDGEQGERALESWKVGLYSGPLASPGRLVLSMRRMHFEPGRRLDAALGVKGHSVCWYEVNSIRLKGRLNRKLLFECRDRVITVDVNNPAQRFLDLVSLYRESIGPLEPEVNADVEISEGDARFILQRWAEYLNMGKLAMIVAATPALHWCDGWWMRRGWLVLTAQQLLFIPSGPPRADSGVVVLPLTDCSLGKHADSDGGLDRLILESGNQSWVFSPLAGPSFVDRVAQLCGQGARTGYWEQEWGAQFVPLIGEAAFAEFEVDDVVVETLRPAHFFPHEDGIGVFTRNAPDPRLHVGANTVFNVSSADGMYQLRGAVVVNERIATGQGAAEDMAFLIVIAQSPQLNLTDRRRHFRVDATEAMAGRCMAYSMTQGWYETKHPLRLRLKNLSLSGCAIYSNRELEAGSQVMLYLPPRTKPLRLQAKVVESVQSPEGPQPWFARVQFLQIDKSDTRLITEQIVRFQQFGERRYNEV